MAVTNFDVEGYPDPAEVRWPSELDAEFDVRHPVLTRGQWRGVTGVGIGASGSGDPITDVEGTIELARVYLRKRAAVRLTGV
jgi:hypothetical protein